MAERYRETGRCKTSIAQARITQGSGKFTINKKDINEYLDLETLEMVVKAPLKVTDLEGSLDVVIKVVGGGFTGQTEVICQGLSRALVEMDEEPHPVLEKAGFLTHDPRMKKRKKYGLKKAGRAPRFSKR